MAMQYDVKSAHTNTSGVSCSGFQRESKGFRFVRPPGHAGTLQLKDGGSSGTVLLEVDIPSNSNPNSFYTLIPGEGIQFNTNVLCDVDQHCKRDGVLWLSPLHGSARKGRIQSGGLNAKGRASYNAANPGKPGLKRPQPEGGKRRDSFCARMKGMKAKLTSAKTANDPDSRINKSLRAWNCADGGYVTKADGCATKGKTKGKFV
jgi:hypothetical protein